MGWLPQYLFRQSHYEQWYSVQQVQIPDSHQLCDPRQGQQKAVLEIV
jgi:hypothetical protein